MRNAAGKTLDAPLFGARAAAAPFAWLHEVAVIASALGQRAPQLEQPCRSCTGGQSIDPYEQNTQQSPGFGRTTVLQRLHS
jgi:hypothetical protein